MRKISCLLVIASLLCSCTKLWDFIPLPSAPHFSKTYGGSSSDVAAAVVATSDRGYVMAGWTGSNDGDVSGNHGGSDAWVVRLDGDGKIIWQKALGGSSDHDHATSITTTLDGGYIMAGYTFSNDGDVRGNHGMADAWVVKLDKDGNIVWQKVLGGSGYDAANFIAPTLDGGYVMVGYTQSNDGDVHGNHGEGDAWVVKLDKQGNKMWQKTLGGTGGDEGLSIVATLDGGYIMAGRTTSDNGDVSGNRGDYDAWVVKLDNQGNIIWQKTLGGSYHDDATSITSTPEGGYIMAGGTASIDGDVSGNHVSGDAWLVKLDNDGRIVWQQTKGGSGYEMATSVATLLHGGYVMAGWTDSNDGDFGGNHGAWVMTLNAP